MSELLPDIPRLFTGLSEWLGTLVFITAVGWRRPKTRSATAAVASLPAFVGLQVLLGSLPLSLWMVGMFAAAALIVLAVYASAEVLWSGAVYVGVRAFVLAELVASLEWQLQFYFSGSNNMGWRTSGLWLLGVYVPSFALAYFLVRRSFRNLGPLRVDSGGALGAVAIGLATFLASNVSFGPFESPFSGTLPLDIANVRTLVGLVGFVALHAQESVRMRTAEEARLAGAQMMLKAQHDQYLLSRANIEDINKKYHDLKHHITVLRAETSDLKRLEYLDRLEQSVRAHDDQVRSGNVAIDAILSGKKMTNSHKGITITEVLDGNAVESVDPLDLAVILGNALDNAVEAVRVVADKDKRLVKVAVFRHGNFAVIRVENYFDQPVTMVDGFPVSTKVDTQNHGYGLRNVRETVERYGGSVVVTAEDNWFTLKALLPVSFRD